MKIIGTKAQFLDGVHLMADRSLKAETPKGKR
jgi:hypothetical protein